MPPTPGTCADCKWWVKENGWGQCHRYAPQPCLQVYLRTMHVHEETEPIYPRTPEYEWCGDFVKK